MLPSRSKILNLSKLEHGTKRYCNKYIKLYLEIESWEGKSRPTLVQKEIQSGWELVDGDPPKKDRKCASCNYFLNKERVEYSPLCNYHTILSKNIYI